MLGRRAAVFLPAALPRDGRFAFWDPEGKATGSDELVIVRQQGTSARRRTVPAVLLPIAEAMPLLVAARQSPVAHPAARCWGAAALHALQLAVRGRLLPGLTADDHDAWRAGPLDAEDIAHLRAVAAAMPPEAHATPLPGRAPLELPEPEALLRAFLDAVADTLPRSPAAAHAVGTCLCGARGAASARAAGMDHGGGSGIGHRCANLAAPRPLRVRNLRSGQGLRVS